MYWILLKRLSYRLFSPDLEATVVQVALPRERWRLEFHPDGRVSFMFYEGQAIRTGLDDFWSEVPDEKKQPNFTVGHRLAPFEQQLAFMQTMNEAGIRTTLARHRNALMFEIDLLDQFWEVEFFGDGSIESDQFLLKESESTGGLRRFWIAAAEEL